jgi:predicted ester cyclase
MSQENSQALKGGFVMGDPKQVVERHIAAFNARDADAYPWMADLQFVAPGAKLQGREQVLGFMHGFWDAFPDGRLELVRLISQGSTAAGEGTFAGTHTGTMRTPAGEVPPTDRKVEFRWMAMYELAGDVIAFERLYFDQAELLGQLGLADS